MKDEQLLLKLKKIQDAYVSSSHKADLKKLFEEGVLKLVSGEWFQYKFKSEDWTFEKEISKINSWITFDKCIDEQFNEPQKRVRDEKTAKELKESLKSLENFTQSNPNQ